ncbi:hypothetical protein [Thalassotalea sp. PS06]|uniref:hypothetical protein n=1 Tax=Thalassotalea sp. PS06 TaxID=2594005 RepID=UPI0011648791|nr:hypothetical protein [Thalassotalea sp. PS06]QDP00704.1 hypothetical protein FNC98_04655 [Thalassotalea sp. PS06]
MKKEGGIESKNDSRVELKSIFKVGVKASLEGGVSTKLKWWEVEVVLFLPPALAYLFHQRSLLQNKNHDGRWELQVILAILPLVL